MVSGPSGAGKGTICNEILKGMDKVLFSVSMTTRKPREGEVHGEHYFFVSKEEFEDAIKSNGLLEYAHVYEDYYGTPKQAVIDKLNEGYDVLLDLDIQGAMNLKRDYPKGVFIFILPPSMAELRKRITGRGSETEESIKLRLDEALKEIAYIDKYDYVVVNGDVCEATERVRAIIVAEHSKVAEDIYDLIDKYKEEI